MRMMWDPRPCCWKNVQNNILHPIDVTAVEEDDDGDGDGDNHSPMQ